MVEHLIHQVHPNFCYYYYYYYYCYYCAYSLATLNHMIKLEVFISKIIPRLSIYMEILVPPLPGSRLFQEGFCLAGTG